MGGVVGSCQEVSSQTFSQDLTSPFAGHTLPKGRRVPAPKNQLMDFFVLHRIGKTTLQGEAAAFTFITSCRHL